MKKINIIIIFSSLVISCNHQSKSQLIIGTWVPLNSTTNLKLEFIFFADHTALLTKSAKGFPSSVDSLLYDFSNKEKLILTLKNGKTTEAEILTLSNRNFSFILAHDTISLRKK